MASFNFKSAGTKITDRSVSEDLITKKTADIGIRTPLTNFQQRQLFDMHTDPIAQLKDNLKNLLLTNAGERLGLYDFGADLNAMLFEFSANESAESEAVDRINAAVEKYMPGLSITSVSEVEIDSSEKASVNKLGQTKIRLRVVFDVPAARVSNQAIEVTLQAGG